MTSSRLPGKVLKNISGKTLLAHVIQRCSQVTGIDRVCCAVPQGKDHHPVALEAEACGAVVVRGSEHDVLDRYLSAARALDGDVIMRVTSDCPLIDPELCGQVLAALLASGNPDYAANNFTHRYPHGLDCEAFTRSALERASREAVEDYDREHVTPWLRRALEIRRVSVDGPDAALGSVRWTVDYPEDLTVCRSLMRRLGPGVPPWQEALRIWRANPHLAAINARHGPR